MFKNLGLNTIKIVAERKLRKMLFVAFLSVFSSLLSIENSYAGTIDVLYTVLDDTKPQTRYIQEIRDALKELSNNQMKIDVTDFKIGIHRDTIFDFEDEIKKPVKQAEQGDKKVILGKGTTGMNIYKHLEERVASYEQGKFLGIVFFENFQEDCLKWMSPGRGDIIVLPKNTASDIVKKDIACLRGHLVEYDEFSGLNIAKELYQILTKKIGRRY